MPATRSAKIQHIQKAPESPFRFAVSNNTALFQPALGYAVLPVSGVSGMFVVAVPLWAITAGKSDVSSVPAPPIPSTISHSFLHLVTGSSVYLWKPRLYPASVIFQPCADLTFESSPLIGQQTEQKH